MDSTKTKQYICYKDITIEQVMRILTQNNNRIMFIVNEKEQLLGCITNGDICRYLISGGSINDQIYMAANRNLKTALSLNEAKLLYDKKNFIVIPIVNSAGKIVDFYDGDDNEKRILLIGGGGHCRSVADSLLRMNYYSKVGIVDYEESTILGIPVVGTDGDLPKLLQQGWTDAFISIGSVGDTRLRRKLYEKIKKIGFYIPSIVDPSAIIAKSTRIGCGCYVGKNAVINTGVWIGCCAIINTMSTVEHDCVIGDFVHISPGVTVCGSVSIGNDSHIGAGTVVRQQIQIGAETIIGIGSAVVMNIPDCVVAYGSPCKVVKYVK